MDFRASDYGNDVARILALDGGGARPMALAPSGCVSSEARAALKKWTARELFPHAFSPEGALSGLYLYFSCLDEAHSIAQDLATSEGSFWHGIMHRQEPDPGNAAYWFRRVGKHPVFPALHDEAHRIRFDTGREWDPFEFIEFCEASRARPGSEEERIAMHVQLSEWQLLFDYCAREKTR
ncbi:MAG TPA: hypothetical protein VHB50_12195 [Bryobacteraceae bacterium]|nr:hypothetical protein [Bryobacteraceae bacterium]